MGSSTSDLMVIPTITKNGVRRDLWEAINKLYTYRPETVIITNEELGFEPKHLPTIGTKKLTYAMEKYDPDVIIFHADDWVMEPNGLKRIIEALEDPTVISTGVRPWSKDGGQWHECGIYDTPHCCSIVAAYKRDLYPFVKKVNQVNPITEVWNEACYYACLNGWKIDPQFVYMSQIKVH